MYKKLLSQTIIYGIGAILPRIILFILNPLLINQIENKDFAIFTNLYALISFVNIVLSFGFETAFFRFSSQQENEKKTFNTSFWFLFAMSGIFLFFCILFNQPIANLLGYENNPEYILWFALIAFFDNLCVIPFAWLRFHNMPIKYSAVRVVQSVFQAIFTAVLLLYIPQNIPQSFGLTEKVSYPFFSNLAASFLGFALLSPILLKVRFSFDIALFKKMIKYSVPLMIAGLAFMVNENFDKFIQIYLIPNEEAGAYGGVYKLAVLMTLFVTAYRMGIEPFFFKQMDKGDAKNTYAKITEYFTFFAAIVAMGIIANISWLKHLLIPNSSYWIAIDIIPIIVLANLFFGIYYNFSTWYKVTDRTEVGTFISWVGAIINIVFNYIVLYYYQSFIGSAWVTFASYFVMMLISYFLGQKYYPIPYRIKKMALLLIILFAFSYITVVLSHYNFWVGNALFLLYLGIVVYSEKDLLLSKIKKLK
ncbi:lipopolysaccharide biosynthesis protein [Elizabethkingia sp. JS20170427COW]|uniref:lipopolysaccharide biosynthesis protein n=1 Tax=Elizabethkingia sp. JS20170427COW TaxID=2583851 RepID=UPI0011102746|nr:oligosaccharide flippase family protein [Elizabethkingia sp. JS20170427COW]QCX53606.1 polysaccharide biosynthesis protein [Elizabethkingia sp. JS20170427COW]